ncbi:Highly reducing polyketide synthase gloL [Nosema granulosis]|uniref:Highly reducing polyketide synthase gloL n=1 Tax=Nosema granulosis TaxID=83296 RepID=A0A9P6H260_9MICR|nr:Highly reducing polyketide synthase gloL [Nosema granulosis]
MKKSEIEKKLESEKVSIFGIKDDDNKNNLVKTKKINGEKINREKINGEKIDEEKINGVKIDEEKINGVKINEEKINEEKINGEKIDEEKINEEKINGEKINGEKINGEKINGEKINEEKKKSATKKILHNVNNYAKKMKTPMTKLERKILTNGTIKDKINVLTLQVERNPSSENYKALLQYAENQRHDVVYEVLKNIKDLLIEKGEAKDLFIKQRITKTFEINLKNIFIKKKVLRLVFQLLKNNIYFLDLIYAFINKLGDKKELEEFVVENAKALFPVQEEVLLENLEDFYFKNPSFKARLSLCKLMSSVSPTDKQVEAELYLRFLSVPFDYPEEQRRILLKYLVEGLSSIDSIPVLSTEVEDLLKKAISPELSLYIFKIFYKARSLKKDIFYRILSYPPSEELLVLIFKYILEEKDPKILKYLFNRSLLYRKEVVLAILILIHKESKNNLLSNFYGLCILRYHYSIAVRRTVEDMIEGRPIREIKPFDEIDLEINEY